MSVDAHLLKEHYRQISFRYNLKRYEIRSWNKKRYLKDRNNNLYCYTAGRNARLWLVQIVSGGIR